MESSSSQPVAAIAALSRASAGDFTGVEQVPWECSTEDAALYIDYEEESRIHATMATFGQLPPGLVVGATATESANNLKNWYGINGLSTDERLICVGQNYSPLFCD
jgi:hypothetical protein